jgi:hypothetical protein
VIWAQHLKSGCGASERPPLALLQCAMICTVVKVLASPPMSNNNARHQQSWGHLEESAIAAGAALLPIAMSHKAERTCAGAELFLSGRIQHAVAGEGTGDEELHAKVALLPRIIETLALMLDDAEKAAVWRPEERTAVERLVRVLRDGKNMPLNRETMLPLFHFAGELRLD